MSGLVQRCSSCGAEIVLGRRHRGTSVVCPKCGAASEVPQNVDFVPLDVATARDRERATWLLCGTVAAFFTCCVPASALICWSTSGTIHRARDEDREVEPSLLRAHALAVAGAAITALVWTLAILYWVFVR